MLVIILFLVSRGTFGPKLGRKLLILNCSLGESFQDNWVFVGWEEFGPQTPPDAVAKFAWSPNKESTVEQQKSYSNIYTLAKDLSK